MDSSQDWRSQKTALGHLRGHLENARMAEFVFVPVTDEAIALTKHLLEVTLSQEAVSNPRKRRRRGADLKSFEGSIAAFAADLIHHSQFEEAGGFMYRPSDKDGLGQTMVSVRSFELIVPLWGALGWMEFTDAFQVKEPFEEDDTAGLVLMARARRFRATDTLLGIAARYGIEPGNLREYFRKDPSGLSPVTVRSELPAKGPWKKRASNMKVQGAKLRQRLKDEGKRVAEINRYLATSGFDLFEPPRVFRLFNRGDWKTFDFNMGGRLYCRSEDNWQQAKPEARRLITWCGEPTVELDVRASHLSILYALCGQVLSQEHDPYLIPPYDRELTKGLFTIITGRGSRPTRWTKELGKYFLEAHGKQLGKVHKVDDVLDALYRKHPLLNRIKYGSLDWATLQFEESECFLDCLTRLGRDHGVTGLPIHDSLIVAQRHQELAEQALKEAYQRRLGFSPVIKVK